MTHEPNLAKMAPTNNVFTALIVEDSQPERAFLEAQIQHMGHQTLCAESAAQALEILNANTHNIDVILMDRMMPGMDGVAAVRKIKETKALRKIPVVMVTAATSNAEMQEGLEAGVFYYLSKPVEEEVLQSVLNAAIREFKQQQVLSEELKKHRASFNRITTAKFSYSTLDDAENLAAFIAHCFPEPDRVLSGLGELLINAHEHGNLGIGYDRKTELLTDGIWRNEIERREKLEENSEKTVEVIITRKKDGIYVVITDEGEGFDWKRYISIDPSRAADNHGRGIAQASTLSFDKLTYNAKGNQTIAFVGHAKQLQW